MPVRIVEIAEDGRHLALDRGFMTVKSGGDEIGRVPLDDIGAVIANAHGLTYSNNLLIALAERGASLVVCARNHRPIAWLWPVVGHHAQGARMRAQMSASRPLEKRLWQRIVKAKIAQQASVLSALGRPSAPVTALRHRVGSGDPENMEAQAARRYWPLLFGDDFRRDRSADGVNALLNYGYTVLRAAAARAICAAGLHPSIGISHRSEDMALADDIMEPFRPTVDLSVALLVADGVTEVTASAKRTLALVSVMDMRSDRGVTPMTTCLERLAISLGQSFEIGKTRLVLPFAPMPLELPHPTSITASSE